MQYTRELASRIAAYALYAEYPSNLHGCTAVRFVTEQLSEALLLRERAGEEYISCLEKNMRELDPEELLNDPYMRNIRIVEKRCGNFLLTNATYERGELLQYRMPDMSAEMVVPALGFFPEKVCFPAIYENNMPWVSVCPSEISSMRYPIQRARGNVLTLGCGLGYFAYMASEKESVETVTIVELQNEVIELFSQQILPQFGHPEKVRIVQGDAFEFVAGMQQEEYDMCFVDIWEGPEDGAPAYIKLKEAARRLPSTEFVYWIEKEIRNWILEEYA